jgi:hypothetical protein
VKSGAGARGEHGLGCNGDQNSIRPGEGRETSKTLGVEAPKFSRLISDSICVIDLFGQVAHVPT